MTLKEFIKERNALCHGDIPGCGFKEKEKPRCEYQATNYMDFVHHRRDEHGIPPGEPDVYQE